MRGERIEMALGMRGKERNGTWNEGGKNKNGKKKKWHLE